VKQLGKVLAASRVLTPLDPLKLLLCRFSWESESRLRGHQRL